MFFNALYSKVESVVLWLLYAAEKCMVRQASYYWEGEGAKPCHCESRPEKGRIVVAPTVALEMDKTYC